MSVLKSFDKPDIEMDAGGIILFLIIFAGLMLISLWIIQTAVGYFGVTLSMWQSFVVILASFILFRK